MVQTNIEVEALPREQPWFKGSYYEKLLDTGYVYEHGLPFSMLLARNIDDLIERIRKKKASLIIVDGGVGEGKTTEGVHLGDYVNVKYGDRVPIDLKGPQMAMGGKEFGEKLIMCHDKNLLVIMYDEAGDFDKKTTLSRFNRNLMRIFEMYRGFRILVIICLPRFYKLENELFDLGIPRLLIHCENRTENTGNFRAFDLEQMYYIKHHAMKIIVKPKCYDFGMCNFHGHFLDLPPERSRELDAVSVASKRRETKKAVYDVKGRVNIEQIKAHFGMSTRWVRMKLKDLEGEEIMADVVTFEKKKYYKKEVLQLIAEQEDALADGR